MVSKCAEHNNCGRVKIKINVTLISPNELLTLDQMIG
jgi:hypothetical protein